MNKEDLFQVGVITTPHGVHGEVNVFPTTDDPRRFKKLKKALLDTGKELKEIEISQVKFFKQMVILKITGLDDRNEAEKLRKCSIYVTRDNAVKLQKDEYYIADLIGVTVIDSESGSIIGTLTDVLQTGANDVYEIELSPEFLYQGKAPLEEKIYVPAIKDCVMAVDIENKKVCIRIMPGLIG